MNVNLYTKKQTEQYLARHAPGTAVPTKREAVVIAFPRTAQYLDEVARITATRHRATYGGLLYEVRAGRVDEVFATERRAP